MPVVFVGLGIAVAIGAKGIGLDAVGQLVARVERHVVEREARVTVDGVDVREVRIGLDTGNLHRAECRQQRAVGREEATIVLAVLGIVVELVLAGDIDEAAVAQAKAEIGADAGGLAAVLVIAAAVEGDRAPVVGILGNHVDHAGDGVRPVLGGGAVLQHFDAADRAGGNEREIGGRAARIGAAAQHRQVGGGMAALAVDQHQRVIGAQPAQCGGQGEVGGIAAKALEVERWQALRQHLGQVLLAHGLQRLTAEELDRGGAVFRLHADLPGAGDDDVSRRFCRRGLLRIGGGGQGNQQGSGAKERDFHPSGPPKGRATQICVRPTIRAAAQQNILLTAYSGLTGLSARCSDFA